MRKTLFLTLGIAALVAGCSVLIKVDGKQCSRDADCAALGSAFNGSVCEQNVCVVKQADSNAGAGGMSDGGDPLVCKTPPTSTAATVKYSFAPVFAQPPASPKPFIVKACAQLDLNCNKPVFGPVNVTAGEAQDFLVPPGFNGYFDITNPDTLSGLLFMGRPIVVDTVGWDVTVPSETDVALLGVAAGKSVDLQLGVILTDSRDCNGGALEGVSFSTTITGAPDLLTYYFVNSLPNTSLTKTGPQGAAGYANVPVGTVVLTGLHDSGKMLGPVSVRVKPHYISFAELFP